MSKPSYATYVKDRLGGLRRLRQHIRLPGPRRFPEPREARVRRSRPLAPQDARLQRADQRARRRRPCRPTSATSRPRSAQVKAQEMFMSAASPGVMGCFSATITTRATRSTSTPSPTRCAHEYEAIAGGRHRAADRLPGPRPWAVTSSTRTSTSRSSARTRALHVEVLNHATAQHRARADAHAPVLGQLRRAAPLRRAARRHHRHRVPGAAGRDLVRGRQPAPRARVDGVRDGQAARGQGADPRRASNRRRISSSTRS